MLWRSVSEGIRIVTSGPNRLNVRIGRVPWIESGPRSPPALAHRMGGFIRVGIVSQLGDRESAAGWLAGANPYKSPTYPPRSAFPASAARWKRVSDRARSESRRSRQKLDTLGNHPQREAYERIYHQMLGARDQIAETVRRLPLETGSLVRRGQGALRTSCGRL